DDAILGACIFLPDHPQIAPESRGNLFDNTEIEEALMLHVHVLSDAEREEIAQADPAVRAMIERALAATPQEMLDLHGRLSLSDPVHAADPAPVPPSGAAGWEIELPPARVMEPATGVFRDTIPAPVWSEPTG